MARRPKHYHSKNQETFPPMTHIRVFVPDTHGNHIDLRAAAAFFRDLRMLAPDEIVLLGDHLDCGGTFSAHQRSYTNEFTDSYKSDTRAANAFLDELLDTAPSAKVWYLEGNHEAHVERWASRNFAAQEDAEDLLECFGPEAVLRIAERPRIRYISRKKTYMGLTIPGTIRLGKCFATHGISFSKHADEVHLARFGASVVFGHVHRSMSVVIRTVTSAGHGAWCPGTLAKLQPLYKHTEPTAWTHGYAVQVVSSGGKFLHFNVPIMSGESLLGTFLGRKLVASRAR